MNNCDKEYSVKQVAEMSGISVRTLHHYDQIDLLKPTHRTESGYRYYGEQALLKLQQILFYKELDLSLNEIKDILDQPSFDVVTSLERHKRELRKRQKRISGLLNTIDNTITEFKKGNIMSNPESLYKGLPKEMGTKYRREAMEKYGKDTVEKAEQNLLQMGKDGYKNLQNELKEVTNQLFILRDQPSHSSEVQGLIKRHYRIIRTFWGAVDKKDPQAESYAGLGELYVQDDRYTKMLGRPQPEFAAFLRDAMRYFADNEL